MKNNKVPKKNNNKIEPSSKIIEVEAKTVQAAIKEALSMLHVKENDVTIQVLKEEHKGLFGMEGAEKAKIKVTLKKKK